MADAPPFLSADGLELERWFDVPTRSEWEAAATKLLKGKPLTKLSHTLLEGVPREPLYDGATPVAAGVPDAAPYVRGSRVLDRRQAGWDARTVVDAGSMTEAAAAVAADVAVGCRSVWLVPDAAGRGLPGDGAGVSLSDDLGTVLAALDLTQHPVHVEGGLRAAQWIAQLTTHADGAGVAHDLLTGAITVDPMAIAAVTGDADGAFEALVDAYGAASDLPWVQVAQVSTLPWAEAGADAVQELAWLCASAAALFRGMGARGFDVAALAPKVLLQTSLGRDTFVEIAKQRAARRLYAAVVAGFDGDAEAQRPFVHAVTSRSLLAARDPWVNLLRSTHGAFIGAVAGVDALSIVPWDRGLGVPEASARRAAATMHAVLEAEAHLARVADPAGGSWYVEHLTDVLATEAWSAFQAIEADGGMAAALASGRIDSALADTVAAREKALRTRKQGVLGVSLYPNPDEDVPARTAAGPSPAAFRDAALWESLRDAADAADVRPMVHLATLGPLARHTGRADFAAQLFAAGGFAIDRAPGAASANEAVDAFAASKARVAVVCGTDDAYAEHLPALGAALKGAGAEVVVLAGRPQDAWAPGLDEAVFVGADVWDVLHRLHQGLGVIP